MRKVTEFAQKMLHIIGDKHIIVEIGDSTVAGIFSEQLGERPTCYVIEVLHSDAKNITAFWVLNLKQKASHHRQILSRKILAQIPPELIQVAGSNRRYHQDHT